MRKKRSGRIHQRTKRAEMESQSQDKSRSQLIPSSAVPVSDALDAETAVTLVPADALKRQIAPRPNTADLFWESCGGIDTYGNYNFLDLTVVEEDTAAKSVSVRFSQPVVIIGRLDDCDLRLTRREVSRRHAYLQMVGGRWMCVDLGSGNGIRWPSGRHRYGWLEPGGQIMIGPYQISSALPNPEYSISDPLSSISVHRDRPEVYLEFLNARSVGGGGQGWALRNRVTLVGSHEVCEMQINDATVAEFHASLVLTPQGLWVVNLAADGHTSVNSQSHRWQRLRNGDELQIGRFRLRTHYGAVESEPAPPPSPPVRVERRQSEERQVPQPQPAPPPMNGVSEGFVLQLMTQVASMQQQFMDHSQQQMMMTLQMLAASRSAPPGLSEELARVQQLTRELEAMREQMNRNLTQAAPAPAPAPTPVHVHVHAVPAPSPASPEVSALHAVHRAAAPTPESQQPIAAVPAMPSQQPAPAEQPPEPPIKKPLRQPKKSAPQAAVDPVAQDAQPTAADPKNRKTRQEVEMHASLLEGMARLEAERNSTWSRIIKSLMGSQT